jgi:hypothetical protein
MATVRANQFVVTQASETRRLRLRGIDRAVFNADLESVLRYHGGAHPVAVAMGLSKVTVEGVYNNRLRAGPLMMSAMYGAEPSGDLKNGTCLLPKTEAPTAYKGPWPPNPGKTMDSFVTVQLVPVPLAEAIAEVAATRPMPVSPPKLTFVPSDDDAIAFDWQSRVLADLVAARDTAQSEADKAAAIASRATVVSIAAQREADILDEAHSLIASLAA